jgi:hypothetical protein
LIREKHRMLQIQSGKNYSPICTAEKEVAMKKKGRSRGNKVCDIY